jgi:glutamate synthase domain-containing protein 3
VVILGKTGRNFGAGFSGGYAYVWDKWKEFAANFNNELSDIETISAEDAAELKGLIEEHFQYTQSNVAKTILENWDKELKFFKKVMPRDYKRVMEKKKLEKKDKKELVK